MRIENKENGFTRITLGNMEITLPTVLHDWSGERIEIRGAGKRVFIELGNTLYVSPIKAVKGKGVNHGRARHDGETIDLATGKRG